MRSQVHQTEGGHDERVPKTGCGYLMATLTIRRKVLIALVLVTISFGTLLGIAASRLYLLLGMTTETVRLVQMDSLLHKLDVSLNSGRGLLFCAQTGDGRFLEQESSANFGQDFRALSGLIEQEQRDQPEQGEIQTLLPSLAEVDSNWQRLDGEANRVLRAQCESAQRGFMPRADEVTAVGQTRFVLRAALRASLDRMERVVDGRVMQLQLRSIEARSAASQLLTAIGLAAVVLAFAIAIWLVSAAAAQDELNQSHADEVAQRRIAERRLIHSEARVRTILENVPDGVVTIDEHGLIESFNQSAERIFGYRAAEVLGRNVSVLMPEPVGLAHDQYMERHIATGEKRIIGRRRELLARHADGARFTIDIAVTEGWVDGERLYTGIVRDVSHIKRQNEEIKRFKTMLDNTLDMIFMFDPISLVFTYANRGAEESLGFAREEFLRMRASDLTPAMPEQVFRSHIAQLLSGSRPWLSYETSHRRRDGLLVPTEVFLQLIRSDADDSGLFIAIVRDLTERRRIDRLKSEFISIIGHELRSPLTSIRGSLGLLMGGAAGILPERAQRMVEIARNNSERLVRLINDMLDMDKIESGKMRFEMRPIEVSKLVEQSVEANRGYGAQYSALLVADPVDYDLRVLGDFDRLMQVMNNLLSNAAKFSPTQGQVSVQVERRGARVRISVTDRGPGIPEGFRARVFERFSQADTSDARQKGGTGLGLSICRAIVERHDGLIDFDTVLGRGTTFWFELPLWHNPAAMPGDEIEAPARLLICEEDVDVAHIHEATLRQAGYRVDIAYGIDDARRALRESRYFAVTLAVGLAAEHGVGWMRDGHDEQAMAPPIVLLGPVREEPGTKAGGCVLLDSIRLPEELARLSKLVERAVFGRAAAAHLLVVALAPDLEETLQAALVPEVRIEHAHDATEALERLARGAHDVIVVGTDPVSSWGCEMLARRSAALASVPVILIAHAPVAEPPGHLASVVSDDGISTREVLAMIQRLAA